ncbi:3-deoxy-8-phosphooctulonate synthase [Desulfurivibrio dismutans]|uniref:3-deoxy-8-phosphooctulonate synthase n=1 Tax=Desulfurivibrio dismutans TaxID=1398908 RepID=UPI0023DB43FF|nr:3-deoxy-8-phosphooctulonate synthase [Desulfurivibrio alkaliphilus]MDF1613589.1 3-deoxy-8-phosphooctulonate synthase [Desulfurivibrio alkaliphilus]
MTETMQPVEIAGRFQVGPGQPLCLLAGPCVIESEPVMRQTAGCLKEICSGLGINLIFKASFDKANRTSLESYRGPGAGEGLALLAAIGREFELPLVSDVHESGQVAAAAAVLDVLQIPAFLCRQTDLLVAAAQSGKPVNLKKGQFAAPWDMAHATAKIRAAGAGGLLLTERGSSFGYNNLVVDMRSLPLMRELGCPVIFDATHSVQLPGGAGGTSGGQRRFVPTLARAAAAVGIDGLFMEVHPDPDRALCDGPNSWPLGQVEELLRQVLAIHQLTRADIAGGGHGGV